MDFLLLFFATILVRIITVTIGGGGMVLIPMLIFLGLPPSEAIATNRLSFISICSAVVKFHKKGLVMWKLAMYLAIPALIGAIFGGLSLIYIDQELFKKLLGFVILISLPILLYKKDVGITEIKITKLRIFFGSIFMLFAGFLGGMFASTGIWMSYALLIFGLTMLQSAGTKKVLGFIIGASTFMIFIYAGLVRWPYAIVMMMGSGIGAWIGAGIGIKLGNAWIKRLFIVIVIVSAIKLLFL